MDKRIAIPIIVILVVGLAATVFLYVREANRLRNAEAEIGTLEGKVTTLEADLAEAANKLKRAEAEIGTLEGKVSTLEADLAGARNTLRAQKEELKKVKYPRHFQSVTELAEWLRKDDTDIKYKDEEITNMSFILQVRALWGGYLLPVSLFEVEGSIYVINTAVIGDSIYWVWVEDDYIEWFAYIHPQPLRPIPPP